jgi:hypothetical protein
MSSLFLNSPSTNITLPFSSTSVHRSLGSSAAFAVCVLGALKMELSSPISSEQGRSSGFNGFVSLLADMPHSLSCHVGLLSALGEWSEEAYRWAPDKLE